MRELIDLVRYVSPQRLTRLSYFFRKGARKRKTYADRLYEAVVKKKVDSDGEASKLLFDVKGSSQYYKLKHDLRQQLINSVLLIDNDQKTRGKYYEAFIRCRKELYAAEVLFVESHEIAAMDILRKMLARAIEAQLTDIIIPALFYMNNYAVTIKPDLEAYERYSVLYERWTEVRDAEERLKKLYFKLIIKYAVSAAPPTYDIDAAEMELQQVSEQYPDVNTALYYFYFYFIKIIIEDTRNNYRQSIDIGWKAVEMMGGSQFTPRGQTRVILLQIIDASIRLRAMNDGRRAVLQSLKLVDEGDAPWFQINQLYLYLCLRSDEYATAVNITNRMFLHRKFRRLPVPLKERWYLLRAYLSWILITDDVETQGAELDDFRLGRFLNNVPNFAKDKLGLNVPVLVIQTLWLLQQKKYLETRKRLESLKRYSLRYLASNNGLMRTYFFVRVLTQLGNANFHRAAFIRKSAPFYQQLIDQPASENLQSVEVEIIPYEDLYRCTLNLLSDTIR